jgi:hypothetical protein
MPLPPKRESYARQGQKGISGHGKRMVRSGCAVLEREFGRENLSFGTATLPSLSPEDCQLVTIAWPELARQFMQELKRLLVRRGLSPQVVYVTEIQSKRWKFRQELAPHLHWICQGRRDRRESWRILPGEIRAIWKRLIEGVALGYEVDCSAATRIERIRKSAAGYLSKYMSKGGEILEEIKESGLGTILPTSWWGMSRELRARVKDEMVEPPKGVISYMLANRRELKESGLLSWYYEITVSSSEGEFLVGMVGAFSSKEAMWKIIGDGIAYISSEPEYAIN